MQFWKLVMQMLKEKIKSFSFTSNMNFGVTWPWETLKSSQHENVAIILPILNQTRFWLFSIIHELFMNDFHNLLKNVSPLRAA